MKNSLTTYCLKELRREDYERYLCILFAKGEQRDHLAHFFAWRNELDKIKSITEEPLIAQMRLQWWHDTISSIEKGIRPPHFIAQALSETIEKCNIPFPLLHNYIDAFEQQLQRTQPADLNTIEDSVETLKRGLCEILNHICQLDNTQITDLAHVEAAYEWMRMLRLMRFDSNFLHIFAPISLDCPQHLQTTLYHTGLCFVLEARQQLQQVQNYKALLPPLRLPYIIAKHHINVVRNAEYNLLESKLGKNIFVLQIKMLLAKFF